MLVLVLSILLLVYVWGMFPVCLFVVSTLISKQKKALCCNEKVAVSVVIAAHNEFDNLQSRIDNIFQSDYPHDLIEVLVASDGSTDDTQQLVRHIALNQSNVKLVDIKIQGGRSNAHNKAMESAEGDICIFTDAETIFDKECITRLVASFDDGEVGFASGLLGYVNQDSTVITQSSGLYWRFEMWIRKVETTLGLYVFGTGACCAVRSELYRPIPATGDVDFTTPLDVVLAGYKCMHVGDAYAWDTMPASPSQELKARIRMTAKNFYGTVTRWGILGVIRYPLYSWVIFSHKIGRWLTPYAMLGIFSGTIVLLDESRVAWYLLIAQGAFYALALAGAFRLKLPLAGAIYSFCLSNIGFFIGVLRAITGRVPRYYKPISQSK